MIMKKSHFACFGATLAISAVMLLAQENPPHDGNRPDHPDGPPRGHHHPPPPPVIEVLDANHDGVIDAEEIANASKALLTLDKNGDGKLTFDELRPPFPPGPPPDGEFDDGPEDDCPDRDGGPPFPP